jgi:hypothetical protein
MNHMTTLQQPKNSGEEAQVQYGNQLIANLIDSTITCFGANERGEIYLSAIKDGILTEVIVGKDEATGDIALFEVEKVDAEVRA